MWIDRAAVAAFALAVAACSDDPTLEVVVEHDPGIAPIIATTIISIYAKPELACAQIEFGEVGDAELSGALAAQAALGEALVGIPRQGDKIVVARGYDADGVLVAAGCNDKGVVDHAEKVVVATVPTATVAVGLGMSDTQRGLVVETTDAMNASIDGRAVVWRLYGAAGTSADAARYTNVSDGVWEPKHATCTTDGDVHIDPMPPLLPGGFALALHVSWATEQPRLFTSFTSLDKANIDVGTMMNSAIVAPCVLQKRGGTSSVVCMSSPTEVTTYGYTVSSRSVTPSAPVALPVIAGDAWVGVVGVDSSAAGNPDRDVYAISNKGAWQALNGAPAANAGATWCGAGMLRCGVDYKTVSLQVVPACGTSTAFLLSQSTDTAVTGGPVHLRKQPIRGGVATEYYAKDGAIIGAGCISEEQLEATEIVVRQAVVLELPKTVDSSAFTAAIFDCAATRSPCTVPLPSVGPAVAFTGGAEPELIASTFDATGAHLSHFRVTPAEKMGVIGIKDRLVEMTRQVAASPPRQLVVGQFDDDGAEDIVWSFTAHSEIDIQIAYAREALGEPLSALTAISTPTEVVPQPVDLFVADFNGDTFDEVVFVFQTTILTATNTTVVIVPTGVPYLMPPLPPDDPACN